VAGANTDSNGNTFLKIGWNPIYLEPTTPFRNEVPSFGVEIECEGGGCNGLPCKIDPSVNGVNEMVGSAVDGAGGAAFCVVTVPKGEKANIVVFETSGGSGGSSHTSSSSVAPSTSSTVASSTSTSTSTSTSSTSSSAATSVPATTSSTKIIHTTSATATSAPSSAMQMPYSHPPLFGGPSYTYKPGILIETGSSGGDSAQAMSTNTPEPSKVSDENAASSMKASMLGLVLGVAAAMV
jgi:hypothetical protein